MEFKKAQKSDANELLTLTHNAFLRYAKEVGKEVKGATETLEDVTFDIENKYVLLAVDNNKIIGAVRLETIGDIIYVSRLCSDKGNKSTGEKLLRKAKEIANAKALCLHTSTKIPSLVSFYYKCGFYVHSVSHKRGYPRGLFVSELSDCSGLDFESSTKDR